MRDVKCSTTTLIAVDGLLGIVVAVVAQRQQRQLARLLRRRPVAPAVPWWRRVKTLPGAAQQLLLPAAPTVPLELAQLRELDESPLP